MNWKPELDDLARREAFAREMGGVDKVKRQRDQSRFTVRERIDRLVDTSTFHEIGAVAGVGEYNGDGELTNLTPANCVFGRGKVDGRTVVVVGDDFTVRGGSADASISAKPLMAEEMAHDFRLPIIRVIEGSGGGGSVKTIETKGAANLPGGIGGTRWYWYTTANMARVPVVGLGLGSVAGLGAARLAASHYSVMVKDISAVFVAGPPLECDALFFNTEQFQRSALPDRLGCERRDGQQVRTYDKQRTCRPGLFLAGDADGDVQFVIAAAAEGARAAVAINRELQDEDRGESRAQRRRAATRPPHVRARLLRLRLR